MTRDVLISVCGTQFFTEDHDTVEIITGGTYHEKGGKHYLRYDEAIEGTEELIHNTVKLAPGKMEILKKGLVESRMVFECGRKLKANYLTPMGLIMLGITTTALDMEEEEHRLRVHVEYALEMNGAHVANCRTDISASSREESRLNLN